MSNLPPTVRNTKDGTSKTLLGEAIRANNKKNKLPADVLNQFYEQIADAITNGDIDHHGVPYIEVPQVIVEHYNRNNMEGFEKPGYFNFQGVNVYLEGTYEAVSKRTKRSIEDILFASQDKSLLGTQTP